MFYNLHFALNPGRHHWSQKTGRTIDASETKGIQNSRSIGHTASHSVAEPMAEPGRWFYRCCADFWWMVTACFLAGVTTALDIAFYNPLGSMEATYNEPNGRVNPGLSLSRTDIRRRRGNCQDLHGQNGSAQLSQWIFWHVRWINMTLLESEARILPSDDACMAARSGFQT